MGGDLGVADSPALNLKREEVEVFEAAGGTFDGARGDVEGSGEFVGGGNVGEAAAGGKFVEIEPKGVLCARETARSHEL